MCLIVHKEEPTSTFTNRQFKNMISRNPHGFGVMYRKDGRVVVERTMGSSRDKFALFQKIRHLPSYAMHARIKTHGLIDMENCHPYEILNIDKGDDIDLFLMHNGTIFAAADYDKTKSDTWHYVQDVLKPLFKANVDMVWNNQKIQSMITKDIGSSRLLIMRSDGPEEDSVRIFNYSTGTEKMGCWLSNTASEPSKSTRHTHFPQHNHVYVTDLDKKKNALVTSTATTPQYDWDGYIASRGFKEKKLANGATLLLPNHDKRDKIVDLRDFQTIVNQDADDPMGYLREQLDVLRGMSQPTLREFVRNQPDDTADIILGLYDKNTMTYEDIMSEIKKGGEPLNGIVRILQDMTIKQDRIKHCR